MERFFDSPIKKAITTKNFYFDAEQTAMCRYVILIPAYNEEESISRVLSDIMGLELPPLEVIVVDNGSCDRTLELAKECGARVLRERQRGYGAACLKGLDYIFSGDCPLMSEEVVVFMDADYSDYSEEIPLLLEPIRHRLADFVVGSRLSNSATRQFVPMPARLGNLLAVTLINLVFNYRFTDLGPFRAIRLDALRQLEMTDRTWGWTVEMQIKAVIKGIKCLEVPVRYRARYGGKSKISGSIKGVVKAGSKILCVIGLHTFRFAYKKLRDCFVQKMP